VVVDVGEEANGEVDCETNGGCPKRETDDAGCPSPTDEDTSGGEDDGDENMEKFSFSSS